MSSPATPKSIGSGSESCPQSPSSTILTPSRKVKALLAQFDDETESEDELQRVGKPARPGGSITQKSRFDKPFEATRETISDGEDDEDLPLIPRGRTASKMQAQQPPDTSGANNGSAVEDGVYSGLKKQIASAVDANEDHNGNLTSSLDDQATMPKRRLLKRKQNQVGDLASSRRDARSASPMFFSPSAAQKRLQNSDGMRSDDSTTGSEDLPDNILEDKPNSRFLKLVEEHRRRRQEKEAMDAEKRIERIRQLQKHSQASASLGNFGATGSSGEDESDVEERSRMMPQSRPTRGASKRAVEEMRKEQQRITRNMQLTHQATTRKKVTKESLLATFNFRPSGAKVDSTKLSGPVASSSTPPSDAEGRQMNETPPTSPMTVDDERSAEKATLSKAENSEELELSATKKPSIERIPTVGKGKGKAMEQDSEEMLVSTVGLVPQSKPAVRPIRVQLSRHDIVKNHSVDDELDIVTSEPPAIATRKVKIFERLPRTKAKETSSHLILRSLAQLNAPASSRSKQAPSMTSAEMDSSLRRQARLQAAQERAAKIEELKAKGIVIQSAEEREKEQQEVEDLLEKARQEGAEIARREKEIAKKNGEHVAKDGLDDSEDDEEDGDFTDEDEMGDAEGSASGEEDDGVNDDEGGEGDGSEEDAESEPAGDEDGLIENEAEEQGSDEESAESVTDVEYDLEKATKITPVKSAPRSRKSRVISDDEDGEEEIGVYKMPQLTTKTPQSVLRSAKKQIPGLPMSDDLPMGLSQAFAATMANSQPGTEMEPKQTEEPDSLTMLQDMPMPEPRIPVVPYLSRLESLDNVIDSQAAPETQPLNLDLSFTQPRDFRRGSMDVSVAGVSSTQFSELAPEPTQDVGYVLSPWMERRFDTPQQPPRSTVETVVMPQDDSPIRQRKGRFRRRQSVTKKPNEAEGEAVGNEKHAADDNDKYLIDPSAFDVMRRASARLRDRQSSPAPDADTEKTKAEAKNMVEDAAEESEDEYAGLGGASDDDAGEEEEEDRLMIDDEGREKLNERMIAELHADKERTNDQAAVSKLLKDITSGALRRKRGPGDDLDLSDEEDAHARRQEAKRREFARMRKELLKSDERIEKIAEDPRKMAFLRAIEDRDEDEEEIGGANDEIQEQEAETQSQETPAEDSHRPPAPNSEAVLRPAHLSTTNRLPASLRRTTNPSVGPSNNVTINKKPASLTEIRESLSFLIEEPDSQTSRSGALPSPISSDSEADDHHIHDDEKENASAFEEDDEMADFIVEDSQASAGASERADAVFKKPPMPPPRLPGPQRRTQQRTNVIDRLSLLRQRSSSSAESSSGGGSRMAFLRSSSSGHNFQGPSLLRRATANSSFGSDVGGAGAATTERQTAEEGKKLAVSARARADGKRGAVNFRAKMIATSGSTARGIGKHAGSGIGKKKGIVNAQPGAGGFLKGFLSGGRDGSWD